MYINIYIRIIHKILPKYMNNKTKYIQTPPLSSIKNTFLQEEKTIRLRYSNVFLTI